MEEDVEIPKLLGIVNSLEEAYKYRDEFVKGFEESFNKDNYMNNNHKIKIFKISVNEFKPEIEKVNVFIYLGYHKGWTNQFKRCYLKDKYNSGFKIQDHHIVFNKETSDNNLKFWFYNQSMTSVNFSEIDNDLRKQIIDELLKNIDEKDDLFISIDDERINVPKYK